MTTFDVLHYDHTETVGPQAEADSWLGEPCRTEVANPRPCHNNVTAYVKHGWHCGAWWILAEDLAADIFRTFHLLLCWAATRPKLGVCYGGGATNLIQAEFVALAQQSAGCSNSSLAIIVMRDVTPDSL